ncbi:helix-turn-helix transcriptional regulator [Paractinoplanes toevensis]|uniref:HTH luxR-type domain-containing protein n=1 Tax=Paractinoplanes toevensis TaxID=571911 RepID=A0A919TE61_9ACTN|nr:LuxR C-terminal-related transcriptional regulator [Actinoplanes toevensis]GIM93196.1 hypothetical protein Ato02nite_049890 [Actinoplanes toevensis]
MEQTRLDPELRSPHGCHSYFTEGVVGSDTRSGKSIADGNLPPWDIEPFVGRDDVLTAACSLLDDARLVCLTGPGGIGKTRLALRAASAMGGAAVDGAWIIDFAGFDGRDDRSPERLYAHVALALGIRQHGPTDLGVLVGYLRSRRALLILDSCEYLLPQLRDLATQLLQATPNLQILATSRQVLGIYGERALTVPPLSKADSVSLFTQVAIAAGAPPTALADTTALSRLCHQLDGLPLAIRLAAVKTRSLSLPELIDRLNDRFRLLTDSTRAIDDRHSTLSKVVDLSYDMCTDNEQRVWARASVFVAPFDLLAAEAVVAGPDIDPGTLVDLITGLVDKSVITVDTTTSPARYTMLGTLREYGRRQLDAVGEASAVQARHRDHYRRFLEHAVRTWLSREELTILADVRRELPDVLAAIDHSITDDDLAAARALSRDLVRSRAPFFMGFLSLAGAYLRRVITASNPTPADPQDAADLAATIAAAAWIAATQGHRDDARTLLDSADSLLSSHQLPALAPVLFARGGGDTLLTGDRNAIGLLAEARARFAEPATVGDKHMTTMMWSIAHAFAGDIDDAEQSSRDYLNEAEQAGAPWAISWALWASALAALQGGRLKHATKDIGRCLELQRSMDDQWGQTWSIELCAWIIAARLGDAPDPTAEAHRAAWLLGAARARQQKLGVDLTGLRPLAKGHAHAHTLLSPFLSNSAVEQIAQGGEQAHHDAVDVALGGRIPRRLNTTATDTLTERESQVAKLIAEGFTSPKISEQLNISTRTVDAHIRNIMGKLGVHTRAAIVARLDRGVS